MSTPTCPKHPDTPLICPRCRGARGAKVAAKTVTPNQFKKWGKLGGRPRKPKTEK